jgi:2-keto-4-pentenoate hydratase/2-oxohepta-3-ene-1,7-dioic acid hydratase in catechol pathway
VYCAGANYRDHIAEMARAAGDARPMDPRMQGNMPWHFIRPARSCVVADQARVERPAGCLKLDWEVELAVVIGETARHVPVDRALDHVAGYAIAIDLSARDLSRRPLVDRNSPFYYDWLAHKGFEGSCPLGPYMTLAGGIEDPQDLPIRLSVNGEVKQDSNTSEMIFSVAEQLSQISRFVTLHPGDVILTGTPAGVGAASGTFLQPGDVLTASIGGLGTLSATIA